MNNKQNIVDHVPSISVFFLSAVLLVLVQLHVIVLTPVIVKHVLEVVSVAVLFVIFWSGVYKGKTYVYTHYYIVIALLTSVAYVIPLSFIDVFSLPGRELYANVSSWLVTETGSPPVFTLSIIPNKSILALLALLPLVAMFYAAISLSEKHMLWLVYFLLLTAGFQSILGVIQYSSGSAVFYFGIEQNARSAQGTYINRDHFSALLVMFLPVSLGLLLFSMGRASKELRRRVGRRESSANQVIFFLFIAVFIFIGAIFSRSRVGVTLIMLGVLLSTVVFSRHIGGKQSVGLAAIFTTIGLGIGASIGLIPVLNRFVSANPVEDERWRIFAHSIEGIKSFFPFGSGPGTFSDIYRAFQPVEQLKFVNNAHNDYLELLFEMGAVGVIIILGFLLIFILGILKLRSRDWDRVHFVQIASVLSVFLMLLHALMDFIFHEPMNAMIFCFLVGCVLRKRRVRGV